MKQTTKKLIALLLGAALMLLMLAGCGQASDPTDSTQDSGGDTDDLISEFLDNQEQDAEDSAALEYDPNGSVVPGTYVYDDYKADMDFSIVWTLVLNDDGSYTLSEDNPFIGVADYAGQTSESEGNRLTCGAMDPDKATTEGDWAYPTGFSVLVNVDDMTFQPENISDEVFGRDEEMDVEGGEPQEGENSNAVSDGTYVYDDYKQEVDAHIIWTLTVNEDGSFTLSEDNPFGGLKEYAGTGASVEGDKIVCGPMDPAPEQGDWAFPEGFTVQITGEGTFEPTVFESFGEAGPNG